jgi:DNA processing protein
MMLPKEELKYLVALGMIPGIGGVLTRFLVSYAGSPRQIFKMPVGKLLKVPRIGEKTAKAIHSADTIGKAEKELEWCDKNGISVLSYLDELYPKRLSHCNDGPVLLYAKGQLQLNAERMLSIIGTRHATEYGRQVTEQLVEALAPYDVTIVSGLALGIDIAAHKAALKFGLPTIGVLGHGHDTIYPWQNKSVAQKMLENGGLLSEYPAGTGPERNNFPQRNRIVAGMCDATIVVESAETGGAMITADMAFSYNREVFAVPGRWKDEYARGCLKLIKDQKAQLLLDPEDIVSAMGWKFTGENESTRPAAVQTALFQSLEEPESTIVACMVRGQAISLDQLHYLCNLPLSTLSSALLSLEFKGVVSSLPGKRYSLN